jgi:crossover junction endonuclease MUS81
MEGPPGDLKHLFIEWLQEAAINATKKGTKAAILYNKALGSVRNYPLPINDPKTLKLVQFVGDKTCIHLSKKLEEYCKLNNFELPVAFGGLINGGVGEKRKHEVSDTSNLPDAKPKKQRKQKQYIPRKRSGGYAILLALYFGDKKKTGLTKEEIIQRATPYSDKSFKSNPSANEFYSAWSSIKSLQTHDLVDSSGRSSKSYFLTEEGYELAKQLKDAEGFESSPITNHIADLSFDNQVRVTPDSSYSKISQQLDSSPLMKTKNNKDRYGLGPSRLSSTRERILDLSLSPRLISSPLKPKDFVLRESLSSHNSTRPLQDRESISKAEDGINTKTKARLVHDASKRIYDGTNYDIWVPGEFEIILIIDNREIRSQRDRDFFQTRLTSLKVECDVRPLSVGDVVWTAKHKKTGREVILNYICERKRLDDLVSSIKDGRFQEQKNRLKKSGMKQFYYLVEDVVTSDMNKFGDMSDAIQTAMSMTMTISNFYLKRFKSIEDTIAFLASLTQVIKDQFAKNKTNLLVLKARSIKNQAEYSLLIAKFKEKFENRLTLYECAHLFSTFQDSMGKTGMMTVKETFILMLMGIRGVSLERAVAIQNRFKTPKNLIEFFFVENNHLSELDKKQLMMDVFKNEIGNKKIGKVLLEKIYDVWGCV